jgi:quercetin dioxygenase-like cupin family protein
MTAVDTVQVLDAVGPRLALVDGEGEARAVVWPGVGARLRSLHLISLRAGARTRSQRHPGEAVYYVVEGSGEVRDPDGGEPHPLEAGSMIHVAPDARYAIAARGAGVELVGGPSPPDPALYERSAPSAPDTSGAQTETAIRIFHRDRPDVRLPIIASDARMVVWPGVDAVTANMNYVRMEPGEENVPHEHPESEDTIFILSGRGSVDDLTSGVELEFHAGQAIQVPPGVRHRVRASRGVPVVSVGGPCPADFALLRAAGALPTEEP